MKKSKRRKFLVQIPVLDSPRAKPASSRDWSRSLLSGFCMETEALEQVSGRGFGFMWEGSCGRVATSFSIAGGCSHPCDGGRGLLHLPPRAAGEQELKMQASRVGHFEIRPRA